MPAVSQGTAPAVEPTPVLPAPPCDDAMKQDFDAWMQWLLAMLTGGSGVISGNASEAMKQVTEAYYARGIPPDLTDFERADMLNAIGEVDAILSRPGACFIRSDVDAFRPVLSQMASEL